MFKIPRHNHIHAVYRCDCYMQRIFQAFFRNDFLGKKFSGKLFDFIINFKHWKSCQHSWHEAALAVRLLAQLPE